MKRVVTPASERFWPKVDKNGPVPEHCPELGPCWIWQGGTSLCGYGRFRAGRKVDGMIAAHRWSLQQALGRSILAEHHACHRCDVRLCVNPKHLFEGTLQDNERDKDAKGRRPRGHRMPEESVCRGSRNKRAKLSETDVARIKSICSATTERGVRAVLARQYGINATIITRIMQGKVWRHVQ